MIKRAMIMRAHRSIAVFSLLIIMFTAVTGFLLQHAEDFGWQHKPIEQAWLLDLYHVQPTTATAYRIVNDSKHYAIELGHLWYINQHLLHIQAKKMLGAVNVAPLLVVASEKQLHLFTADFTYVESIDWMLDGVIRTIGEQNGVLLIQTYTSLYQADASLLSFTKVKINARADFSNKVALPLSYAKQLPDRVTNIHYLRLMQDLHGGRLFGLPHWLIPDLTALALLFLSVTGFMMHRQRRKAARKPRKY